jgi:hypothetical protein
MDCLQCQNFKPKPESCENYKPVEKDKPARPAGQKVRIVGDGGYSAWRKFSPQDVYGIRQTEGEIDFNLYLIKNNEQVSLTDEMQSWAFNDHEVEPWIDKPAVDVGEGWRLLDLHSDEKLVEGDQYWSEIERAWKPTLRVGLTLRSRIGIDIYRRRVEKSEPVIVPKSEPKPSMCAETLAALDESIVVQYEKAAAVAKGETPELGPSACPLCRRFYHLFDGCTLNGEKCPVYAKTGKTGCHDTPYGKIENVRPYEKLTPEMFFDEAKFLESLKPVPVQSADAVSGELKR